MVSLHIQFFHNNCPGEPLPGHSSFYGDFFIIKFPLWINYVIMCAYRMTAEKEKYKNVRINERLRKRTWGFF